jgi:ADP-dependent phosphofructokinase/glucokinase
MKDQREMVEKERKRRKMANQEKMRRVHLEFAFFNIFYYKI